MKFLINIFCVVLIENLLTVEMCPKEAYHPVCAKNKRTYANRCMFAMRWDLVSYWKNCKCNEDCTKEHDPVCGNNGKIYDNRCSLLVDACKTEGKIAEAPAGFCCGCEQCQENDECIEFCKNKVTKNLDYDACVSQCDAIDNHMCYDRRWYRNQCYHDCNSELVDETDKGKECPDCDFICSFLYKPVCGRDGKHFYLFGNKCELQRAICFDKKIEEVDLNECKERTCPEN